ncbi:MAG: phosphate ABC transporter permease subunit PstC [Planctomycetaceae bacterium]|nr:phosphate ABC transporter permease subunit PstC [Planctomycetaceae bacterium]
MAAGVSQSKATPGARPQRTDLTFGPGHRYWKDHAVRYALFLAASSSVVVTTGIVLILLYESSGFFAKVSLWEFFTDPLWTPLFADAHFGIGSLVAGTLVTTVVALAVALPVGTIVAIYLSEFAPFALREVIKPVLELLSAVPTVIYGYFALLFVTPLLQRVLPDLPSFSMLSAGIVMGIMIIPYVSSLSEDAMRAVPMLLREGSYALGANKMLTSLKVVYPAALSGIGAAYILGISRAIGETMIVAIAAGTQANLTINPLRPAQTITAYIAEVSRGDTPPGGVGYQSIFAAGLTLFLITLGFNILGHILRKRFREAY